MKTYKMTFARVWIEIILNQNHVEKPWIANVERSIYIPTMKKPSDSLALYDYIHEIGAAAIKIAQNHNTSSSVIVIFLYLQVSAQFSRS